MTESERTGGLVTRCPRCQTLYRVAPAQLQARAGQVRCGRCMNVFDGFDGLAVEGPDASNQPVRFEAGSEVAPTVAPEPLQTAGAGTTSISRNIATTASAAAPPDAAVGEIAGPPKALFRKHQRNARIAQLKQRVLRKPSQLEGRVAACVLLTLLLAAQAAYAFRSPLAARYPSMRSALTAMCDIAGCSVPLPQRPDLLKIEASDVHMVEAARPSLIQLTATLRSYANFDLAYPALDLVLTNANEHALARRIFTPEEYLDRNRDPRAGVPPRAEITVALDLDTGDLKAAGFRLDLLAAPAP